MSRRRERERGGHHDFPLKISCLTVPSNFVGETCVSENFGYRKMLRIREREWAGGSRLSVEILLSHSTENLRRGNLCFRKFLVSKNVRDNRERGASRLSIESLLSHNTEKLRRGNLCFRKFLVSKNVKDKREKRGGITTFHRNIVVSQYRKISQGKLVFQKISGIEKC